MEVTKTAFYPYLIDIFVNISKSRFVAIDLELSGVRTKRQRVGAGKPTLQERYLETKAAAEKFQILQVGITCVEEDDESGKYKLRPYNFNLSPLIAEPVLDIERVFSYSSDASDFLLKTGFDFGRNFTSGVPYTSRAESHDARERYAAKQLGGDIADIEIKPSDVEALAFLERVRSEISAWLAEDLGDGLLIKPRFSVKSQSSHSTSEMTRFEKRLVHQLVRAEYPNLRTFSKRESVEIVHFDKGRHDRMQKGRKRDFEDSCNRQKGFRWIIEALAGSYLGQLNLFECERDPETGHRIFADIYGLQGRFYTAHASIHHRPRVIVGHNCFLDMVFIYKTFIGDLPDTVTEFQSKLHALFPTVIDTKYLSTHGCGDISPASSLEGIAHQLSHQETPILELDKKHQAYAEIEALHEAGYDSYLTAQVAIRLSAKLYEEGAWLADAGGEAEDEVTSLVPKMEETRIDGSWAGMHDQDTNTHAAIVTEERPRVPNWEPHWEDQDEPVAPQLSDSWDGVPIGAPSLELPRFEGGMPPFGSKFWKVYQNRLRVFGTQEAICVIEGSTTVADEREEPKAREVKW